MILKNFEFNHFLCSINNGRAVVNKIVLSLTYIYNRFFILKKEKEKKKRDRRTYN